jgi:uncharacterized protein (TIGR03435 family)
VRNHPVAAAGVAVLVGLLVLGALRPPRLRAQSPANSPAFEVASIKANTSGERRVGIGIQPGGRFTATNVPLRVLIRNAYQVQDTQLVGGPDWIDSARFDIAAKAEGDVPPTPPGGPPGPMQLMLRTLLVERFKLAVHHETRELPVYALVFARSDGKLGPQLHPASVDCEALRATGRDRGAPPPFPQPGERPTCGMRLGPGQMAGGGYPLSQLATTLSSFVQRVVVDRTGLAGNFDFDLTWSPDQFQGGGPLGPLPGSERPVGSDSSAPSIFTALEEQLGLKLASQKGPVDVLVIDRVERPTED